MSSNNPLNLPLPYGRQSLDDDDIQAVVGVLKSDFLTQGQTVPAFEQAIASFVGASHAVAVNSATSALHIACMALDLSPGKLGWTVPLTFVASANAIRYCGADVDFVDIDPATGNICISALRDKLNVAEQNSQLPDVLIVVHFAGNSCDMKAIAELCQPFGIKIIEDASHAIGGYYKQKPVGRCQWSDCAVFSFHPVKVITSAEGGMVVTQDDALAERMKQLRTHGIRKDPELSAVEPWQYQQHELGFNYRMSDIHAALGLSQLQKLSSFIDKRNELADIYLKAFHDLPISCLSVSEDCLSAWHLFVIKLPENSAITRQEAFKILSQVGIRSQVHYIPVHTQPYYQRLGFDWGDFPGAELFYQQCLTLPLYPALTPAQQAFVVEQITTLSGRL